jgi:hypothetical protein
MGARKAIEAEQNRVKLTPQIVLRELQRGNKPLRFFIDKYTTSKDDVLLIIETLVLEGFLIFQMGDVWTLQKTPKPNDIDKVYFSRADNTYLFGFIGDTHLGSKYCRYDVLNDLYNQFHYAGVDRIFHSGNWIEGEAAFNKYDIEVYGMENQCDNLAKMYPQVGIVTYAIAGDDHEGWYAQREGINIGKHLENVMLEHGRSDWEDCGYMEAFFKLQNINSGHCNQLLLMHPGGGSAYATSYKPQKIVESFSGGEKPNVLLIGHYHKASYNHFRNVHCIQTGCTQDQTPFLRKKGIHVDVGGGICRLRQDPKTGTITSCQIEFFTYLNKGHYNNRWSKSSKVALPKRRK